jgi:hemerythrin-like domain-containing protein
MRATDILKNEHRVIEQVLDCLDKIVEAGRTDGRIDADAARDAVAFFRTFADRCHHGKEEDRLFPAMESAGYPSEEGPIAVMRHEHVQGRAFVGRIEQAIDGAGAGDAEALKEFAEAAAGYTLLLRDHINKEDHCLFPMADQALGEKQQQALMQEFAHFEQHDLGEEVHARFLAIAESLAEKLGVERSRVDERALHAGCGHPSGG